MPYRLVIAILICCAIIGLMLNAVRKADSLIRAGFFCIVPMCLANLWLFALSLGLAPFQETFVLMPLRLSLLPMVGFLIFLGQMITVQQRDLLELDNSRYHRDTLVKLNRLIQQRFNKTARALRAPYISRAPAIEEKSNFWHFYDCHATTGRLCVAFGHLPALTFADALASLAIKSRLYSEIEQSPTNLTINALFSGTEKLIHQMIGWQKFDLGFLIFDGAQLQVQVSSRYEIEWIDRKGTSTRITADGSHPKPIKPDRIVVYSRGGLQTTQHSFHSNPGPVSADGPKSGDDLAAILSINMRESSAEELLGA